MASSGSFSVAHTLLVPLLEQCQRTHENGACEAVLQHGALHRVQLRVAAGLLSELPHAQASSGVEERVPLAGAAAGPADKPSCPLQALPARPLALGGVAADAAGQAAWFDSHAFCFACALHRHTPCAAPYFAYNAARDVSDAMLRPTARWAALEASPAGRLRPPLADKSLIRSWLGLYLSSACSACAADHLDAVFGEANTARAEAARAAYLTAQRAAAGASDAPGPPATASEATLPAVHRGAWAAALRRAHRDLLGDMSTLEAVTAAAKAVREVAAAGEEGAAAAARAAEALAPFAAPQPLTGAAQLTDIAANLRDALAVRDAVAAGAVPTQPGGILAHLYGPALTAQLGEGARGAVPDPPATVTVLPGTPQPAAGVWVDKEGALHAPPPAFASPASHLALLTDAVECLEALARGEGAPQR